MYVRICAGLIVALCFVQSAFAQQRQPQPCADSETLLECFNRIQVATAPEASATEDAKKADALETAKTIQDDDLKKVLASALTGVDSGGTATAATMSDLAQLFNALGLLSSGDSEGGKLALDLNFLIPVQDVEKNNAQLKAVINTESKPLDPLVQAFGETVREARKDSLQKDISTFGDTQISFTWSLVNSRFGRDYSFLRERIAPMNEAAVNRARESASRERLRALPQLIAKANAAIGSPTATTTKFEDLPSDVKEDLKTATFAAASERAAITRGIQTELNRSGFNRLADLVEQQPQLLFSLSHDIRDEIVGPEQTSGTITWEMTRRNLGAFLRREGRACTALEVGTGKSAQYDRCVNALAEYVGKDGIDLQKQWRVKLAASYHRVKGITYTYAADNVNLTLPEQDRWEIALAAGRPMGVGANVGRLDFELAYDSNLDNDTTNKERFKATLTYTRRVGDMDMPFSVVYANKDQFLGEVDHQISLHLGLKFRQPRT